METARGKISLPKLDWKKATCEVCGETFDYTGQRRPHTCKKGDCKYKYQYKIESETWARHQPTLFEKSDS